jgi:hypothetical protein
MNEHTPAPWGNDACVREITKRLLKAAKDCIEEGEE